MAEKNRTRKDYSKDALEVVRAGLLYVAVKLGDLLDEIVVVGGVVPVLLVDRQGRPRYDCTSTIRVRP